MSRFRVQRFWMIWVSFEIAVSMLTFSSKSFGAFTPKKIATGKTHTCILSADGEIKCWGLSRIYGALGTGDTTSSYGQYPDTMGSSLPTVSLGSNGKTKAIDLCAGMDHTCAVTEQGKVKCWGANDSGGQLGQGSKEEAAYKMGDALPFTDLGTNFRVKKISCGATHTCVVSEEGRLKCWGSGGAQLGLGEGNRNRGSLATEMGDNLPALTGLTNVEMVSAGVAHTCALIANKVRCWGDNTWNDGAIGLELDGKFGDTPETIPAKLPNVKLTSSKNESVVNVEVGAWHSCAVINKTDIAKSHSTSSVVKCWGKNGELGILGIGNETEHGKLPNTMGSNLPAVELAMDNVVSVSPHEYFTCALTKNGKIKCWGYNYYGTLGQGDTQNRGARPQDMGVNLHEVDLGLPARSLSTGPMANHSCAILVNSEIKCWGWGALGQLGYEQADNIGDLPNQMGDTLPFIRFK